MKEFLVVSEKTNTGYSAYSPDLNGCVATGKTKEETEKNMRAAIEFHLEGLQFKSSSPHVSTNSANNLRGISENLFVKAT